MKASTLYAKGQQQQCSRVAASHRKRALKRQRSDTKRAATFGSEWQRGELVMRSFAECHGSTLLGRRGTVLASQAFGDDGTKARQAFLDMVPARRPLAAGSGARRRRPDPERRVHTVFGAQTPDSSGKEIKPDCGPNMTSTGT